MSQDTYLKIVSCEGSVKTEIYWSSDSRCEYHRLVAGAWPASQAGRRACLLCRRGYVIVYRRKRKTNV